MSRPREKEGLKEKDKGKGETEAENKVVIFKEEIAVSALEILDKKMPEKIGHLLALSKEKTFTLTVAEAKNIFENNSTEAQATKKRKLEETDASTEQPAQLELPNNKILIDMINVLKSQTLECTEMVNTVKLWIQLNIPRIEDGNNFGVGIQEETINELGRFADWSFSLLDAISKYFVTRAKLVCKWKKNPDVEDYHRSIFELDEKTYLYLRLTCTDIRNSFSIIYDMINKNLDKIKTPRPHNHTHTLY